MNNFKIRQSLSIYEPTFAVQFSGSLAHFSSSSNEIASSHRLGSFGLNVIGGAGVL